MRKAIWTVALLVMTAIQAPVLATEDVPLTAGAWYASSSQTDPPAPGATPYNDASGHLYFDFPEMVNADCKTREPNDPICTTVNYFSNTNVATTIIDDGCSGSPCMLSITLRVDVLNGTPVFHHTQPTEEPLPTVRVFLAGVSNQNDTKRYWSHDIYYVLGPGTVTMNVPLDPALWSDVDGLPADLNNGAINRFQSALDNIDRLGVTFGGSFFGHGVFTTGGTAPTAPSARFTIENYEVTPIPDCPAVAPCGGGCVDVAGYQNLDTDLYQCVQPDDSLLKCTTECTENNVCPPKRVYSIMTYCGQTACCSSHTMPCDCSSCPTPVLQFASHLECR